MTDRRHCRRPVFLCLALLSGLLLAGCYRHVVKASGPGARDMDTFEPAMPEAEAQGPRRVR